MFLSLLGIRRFKPKWVVGFALAGLVLSGGLIALLLLSHRLARSSAPDEDKVAEEFFRQFDQEYRGRSLRAWNELLDSEEPRNQLPAQEALFALAKDSTQPRDTRLLVLHLLGRPDLPEPEPVSQGACLLLSGDPDRKIRVAAAWTIAGLCYVSPQVLRCLADRFVDDGEVNRA
jgi:hypothetical protein